MKTKSEKRAHFDAIAPQREAWRRKNAYYYRFLDELLAFLVPRGASVLELGCGTGDLLAGLRGEKLRGGQHRLQPDPGREGLEDEVGPFENRLGTSRPPNPAESFDSLVARALDHGARS